jgi:protein TonB
MDNGPSSNLDEGCSPLVLFEVDDEPRLEWLLSARRISPKNLLVGMGGAMLVHSLALLLTLAFPLVRTHTVPLGSYVVVNLIDSAAINDPGSAVPASDGPRETADDGGREEAAATRVDLPASPSESDPEPLHRTTPPNEPLADQDSPLPPEEVVSEPNEAPKTEQMPRIAPVESKKKRVTPPPVKKEPKRMTRTASAVSRTPPRSTPSPSPDSSRHPPQNTNPGTGGKTGSSSEVTAGGGSGSGSVVAGLPFGTAPIPSEFSVSQVDVSPQLIKKVEPAYPFMARRNGINGRVMVKLLVGTDGSVSKSAIVKADPKGIFEQAVLEAIQKWKFKPGVYRGRSVATWIIVPLQFKLSG